MGQPWTLWKLLGKHAHHWERTEWRPIRSCINSYRSQFRHYSKRHYSKGRIYLWGLLTGMRANRNVLWNMQPRHSNWRCCYNTGLSLTLPWNGQVPVKESRCFCSVGQTSEMKLRSLTHPTPSSVAWLQLCPRALSSKVQGYPGGPQNPVYPN